MIVHYCRVAILCVIKLTAMPQLWGQKYLTKNHFRVQVHDINIEPTPHQLRVSQVRLAKKFIIIYLSDDEFFKLSDLCQVRHLIFWLICNKVSITIYIKLHQTFYSKMWLHISVVGKVEHTSLVHGQTKVINKLVHRFIFYIFFYPPRNVGDNLKWKKSDRGSR